MTARSGKRSRSAAAASTSACVSASSNCATAVRKRGVSHSRGCSSTEISSILATALSLFRTHLQRQAGDSLDDDWIPRIGPVRADGSPALSANPHLALGTAVGHGHALGAGKRLRPDRRLPPPREPEPEGCLAELDRHPDEDCRDPPARRQDEDRQEDGEDERQWPGSSRGRSGPASRSGHDRTARSHRG